MKKEKKILFVIGGLRAGGAEKVCVALLNEFYRQEFDVSLMVLNLHHAELSKHLVPGIPLYNLDIAHARSALLPMRGLLKKLQVDTCLSFNFQLSVQLTILKRLFGFRYSLFSRGINTFSEKISKEASFRHKYLNAFLIKQLYRKSDYFIAQSTGMKEDMVKSLGVPENKIRVIFNPVFSFETAVSDSQIRTVSDRQKEILFVGSLKEQKNISFLLRSVKELAKMRADFVFRIVGDGKLRQELEEERTKLQLNDKVVFEGFSDTPWSYYRSASIFVLGSWYEGFPNVLIEALSYGIPVVSVDCKSGPDDIIEESVNGFLVRGHDENVYAEKISEAFDKKWDVEEIQKSIGKFSFETIFNQYKAYLTDGQKN